MTLWSISFSYWFDFEFPYSVLHHKCWNSLYRGCLQGSLKAMPKIWSLPARFTEWAHRLVWKQICTTALNPNSLSSPFAVLFKYTVYIMKNRLLKAIIPGVNLVCQHWSAHLSFTRPFHIKRQCKFLPVERGRAGRSGRGAAASLKGNCLCEAARELEGGILESGIGERTEGWRGRIGGQSTPLSLLKIHLFPHLRDSRRKYLSS